MLREIGLIDPLIAAGKVYIDDISSLAVGQSDPTKTFTGLFDHQIAYVDCPRIMYHLLSQRYSTLFSRERQRISRCIVEDPRCEDGRRCGWAIVQSAVRTVGALFLTPLPAEIV